MTYITYATAGPAAIVELTRHHHGSMIEALDFLIRKAHDAQRVAGGNWGHLIGILEGHALLAEEGQADEQIAIQTPLGTTWHVEPDTSHQSQSVLQSPSD